MTENPVLHLWSNCQRNTREIYDCPGFSF